MTMLSNMNAAVRWLPLVVAMTTMTSCNGIRGATKRRRTTVYRHENYLYNDAIPWPGPDDGSSHEVLHAHDFPAQQDILDSGLVTDDADEGAAGGVEARDEGSEEESTSKSTKAPKKTKAQKRIEKAEKKTKATSMPSVSSSPSSMPSISNQPSVSPAPSNVPTVSNQPSTSGAPSSVPTVSSMPSVSPVPTSMPVALAFGGATTEAPHVDDTPDSALNPPIERVAILNKFALGYRLAGDPKPSSDDYAELSIVTGWYIGNHSMNYYKNVDQVFLEAEMTSYFEPSPFILDYDVMNYFAQHAPIPTVEQSDQAVANAFTTHADRYVDFLRSFLPTTNPFANTVSVDYSTYWEALISQSSQNTVKATSGETQADESKKIWAPIVAIAGVAILLGGAFLVKRDRNRRNDLNRVNDNRWDELGGNLDLDDDKRRGGSSGAEEGDTVILDAPSSPSNSSGSGEHSYVPSLTTDSPLSTVYEGDSNDGSMMGDSPSEVMREMNLSSALEDVDLESETGGVADLPGRHDGGGIGELPEKPVTDVESL